MKNNPITASTYTSRGAIPYTAKCKPAKYNGMRRNRTHSKSLVEHSKPLFLDQLDELDELMEQHPALIIPQQNIFRCAKSSYRTPDADTMYERYYYPVGWKDATKKPVQYGKHSNVPMLRRRRRLAAHKKLRVYGDGLYFTDSARVHLNAPPVVPDELLDVYEPIAEIPASALENKIRRRTIACSA